MREQQRGRGQDDGRGQRRVQPEILDSFTFWEIIWGKKTHNLKDPNNLQFGVGPRSSELLQDGGADLEKTTETLTEGSQNHFGFHHSRLEEL